MRTKKRTKFDPDVTRRDDPDYWRAVLGLAIDAGDTARQSIARGHIDRLTASAGRSGESFPKPAPDSASGAGRSF